MGANQSSVFVTLVSKDRASVLIKAAKTDSPLIDEISPGSVESGNLTGPKQIRTHILRFPPSGMGQHNFTIKLRTLSGSANL